MEASVLQLSLVEVSECFVLIGWVLIIVLSTPAFLCHKESAQDTHFLPFAGSLWHKDAVSLIEPQTSTVLQSVQVG